MALNASQWLFDVEPLPGTSKFLVTVKGRPRDDAATVLRVLSVDPAAKVSTLLLTVDEDIRAMTGARVSSDGKFIAVVGPRLRVFHPDGRLLREFKEGMPSPYVRWSPVAPVMALTVLSGGGTARQLMLWDPRDAGAPRVLASDVAYSVPLEWVLGGRGILFVARAPDKTFAVVVKDVRSGKRTTLSRVKNGVLSAAWRPGSDTVVWTQSASTLRQVDLWSKDLAGGQKRLVARLAGNVRSKLRWSPDGKWLSFTWVAPASKGVAETGPCLLPATALFSSKVPASAKSMVCLEGPTISLWGSYGWSDSGELLVSKGDGVVRAYDPRTKKFRVLFALRNGQIEFAPSNGARE